MLMCIKWFISLFCSCYQCKAWLTRRSGRYQKRRRGVKEENGKEEEEINMRTGFLQKTTYLCYCLSLKCEIRFCPIMV